MSHVLRAVGTAIGTQVVTVLLATATVRDPAGGRAAYPAESAYLLALGAMNSPAVAKRKEKPKPDDRASGTTPAGPAGPKTRKKRPQT